MYIRAICGSFRRRVWHPAIPTPPAGNPPTEFTEFTEVSGVGYSPTDFTDFHRWLGCVIGGVGMAGMPYPPNLCASVSICGRLSLPECSVCSAYSVGHSLCLLCWCICGRHISAGLRPPSDQIPFAARSDCVRHPIRFRPLHDAISRACILRRLRCNTQCVYVLHPFMFAKLRNKFDF